MKSRSRHLAVFVVSDNCMLRAGLSKILEAQDGIFVVGDASYEKATAAGTPLAERPDLIVLDLDSRVEDAIAGIHGIQKVYFDSVILALADLADHELTRKALALGVAGVVLKIQPPAVLLAAIEALSPRQDVRVRPELLETDGPETHRSVKTAPRMRQNTPKLETLTPREHEIIRLVGLGLKNKEIASRLSISDITVRHHLTSIFCKLEIGDRQKLLLLAHRHGLSDPAFHAESA